MNRPTTPAHERVLAKVVLADLPVLGEPCWIFTGYRMPNGYGTVSEKMPDGRKTASLAHRVTYAAAYGPIADGMQIDHLCRNRPCVNPAHLEAVTQAENIRRGNVGIRQRSRTHCPQGHEYDTANTRYTPLGRRVCRACVRERSRASDGRHQEAQQEATRAARKALGMTRDEYRATYGSSTKTALEILSAVSA